MAARLLREWRLLWQDPWQLALVSYLPVLLGLALWGLFVSSVPRQLPVAVIDQDNSQLSRQIGELIHANPSNLPISFAAEKQAIAAMKQGQVFALVLIPPEFSARLQSGKQPTLEIRYNSQFLLVGKLLQKSLQQSILPAIQALATKQLLAKGLLNQQVKTSISPINLQITPLFNQTNNYLAFLMPPLYVALLQIIIMLIFVNGFNHELGQPQYGYWLKQAAKNISSKLVFYFPFCLLQTSVLMLFLYAYLRLPFNGSFAWLVFAQSLMICVIFLLVTLIFLLIQEKARVVSFCTALFAPAFAFMGVTFPTGEMPTLAKIWRELMPSSHYIESHIAIVSYGLGSKEILTYSASYWGYLLLLIPIGLLIKLRQNQWLEKKS